MQTGRAASPRDFVPLLTASQASNALNKLLQTKEVEMEQKPVYAGSKSKQAVYRRVVE